MTGNSITYIFFAVPRFQAGVRQESESSTDWSKTLQQHIAQRRSLPTTIESFEEENLDENNEVHNILAENMLFIQFHSYEVLLYCQTFEETNISTTTKKIN